MRQCKCTSLCRSSVGTFERARVRRRRRLLCAQHGSGRDRKGRACDDGTMRLVQRERRRRLLENAHEDDDDLHAAHKFMRIDSVLVHGSSLQGSREVLWAHLCKAYGAEAPIKISLEGGREQRNQSSFERSGGDKGKVRLTQGKRWESYRDSKFCSSMTLGL